MPRDKLGRGLRDLRVSIIDRCNFRCRYCMPRESFGLDHPYLTRADIMTYEEIDRLVSILLPLGVEKVRLTGGEPLIRRDVERLVELLSRYDIDLALTTNGSLLSAQAEALANAGLNRVTVSLDALDETTFQTISDTEMSVNSVLAGISTAIEQGLTPVKVNAVIQKGVNEHAILDLFEHFIGSPVIVRFIEYMDVGTTNGWSHEQVVTGEEILERVKSVYDLQSLSPSTDGEVASRWSSGEGDELGVITSVSQPFCTECCRARLSSDGKLYTCLFSSTGVDLLSPLRNGASDEEIREIVSQVWQSRDDRYSEKRFEEHARRLPIEMSYIGG